MRRLPDRASNSFFEFFARGTPANEAIVRITKTRVQIAHGAQERGALWNGRRLGPRDHKRNTNMKILVFAHSMEVGGSQTNAIELSATLRDTYGHDVVLFATP